MSEAEEPPDIRQSARQLVESLTGILVGDRDGSLVLEPNVRVDLTQARDLIARAGGHRILLVLDMDRDYDGLVEALENKGYAGGYFDVRLTTRLEGTDHEEWRVHFDRLQDGFILGISVSGHDSHEVTLVERHSGLTLLVWSLEY